MTPWHWILLASAVAFLTKLAGYLAPDSLLDSPGLRRASGAMAVGLLSALVVANTFGSGRSLVLDARIAALVTAAVALRLRAPFLLVVIVGAVAAALARFAGMP